MYKKVIAVMEYMFNHKSKLSLPRVNDLGVTPDFSI